jgi:hypothetical protein
VLKKLLKLVTVFTLLVGCYLGYVRAFAALVTHLTAARRIDDIAFTVRDSRSKKEAVVRAREAFGPKHWTADDELQLRYYNSERGFWMYSQKETRVMEEDGVKYDGRRIKLKPAAIVWRARDGSSTKTAISDEAIIDFNQPLSFNVKPGAEPIVVKYARLLGNVLIRDDRGTPADQSDDLVIGPLAYVDYDDTKLQIISDSDVLIVDRDTRVTGHGLLIQLRPKAIATAPGSHAAGFEGAQSAQLLQNVDILFSDVGKTGMLPGSVTTEETAPGKVVMRARTGRPEASTKEKTKGKAPADAPTPLHVHCDGPMQVDLPKPPLPVKVGPPAPSAPTYVHFTRNVVVRRGELDGLPDQLNSDNLDLTLVPADSPTQGKSKKPIGSGQSGEKVARANDDTAKPSEASATPAVGTARPAGMLGDLALQRVKATGHAVWLQLPNHGLKIRCNELIHEAGKPGAQSLTYFRGDASRKLLVEKFDYSEEPPTIAGERAKRKLESITHIWTMDATLFDDTGDMNRANLVARGPGRLETRPAPAESGTTHQDVPPIRTAVWQDQLLLKNELGPGRKIEKKILILKGQPKVVDQVQKTSLDAADTIVTWLTPKPTRSEAQATGKSRNSGQSGTPNSSFQIEKLLALRDVHLVAPSKNLTARERLEAKFDELIKPVAAPPADANGSGETSSAPAGQPAASDGGAPEENPKQAAPASPEKPAERNMIVVANRVDAKIVIDPSKQENKKDAGKSARGRSSGPVSLSSSSNEGDSGYEIREVRLFGGVSLHQDPSPGKLKGEDATGEGLILVTDGPGRAIFNLYDIDPTLPKEEREAIRKRSVPPARVVTEDMTIEGERIGVNQQTDQAWAYGPGKLVQLTERSMLTDRAPTEKTADNDEDVEPLPMPDEPPRVKEKRTRAGKVLSDKVPLVITWGEKMIFSGRSVDPQNHPAAKAEFYQNVRAEMQDALLYAKDTMTSYTNKPIPLADLGKMKKANAESQSNDARDERTSTTEPKADLTLLDLVGDAIVISRKVDPDRPVLLSLQKITGKRLLYDRRTGEFQVPGEGIVYLYDRGNNNQAIQGNAPMADSNRRTIRPTSAQVDDQPGKKRNKSNALPPLVLTQIKFSREMRGRVGTGKATDTAETRWAEFFGDIEAARARVPNERTIVNYDRPPADTYFLTSQTMRVVTEPPPPGSSRNAPARNFLKAWENAYARTSDTMIQADEITYDSYNDLLYARGQEGRPVQVVQQTGTGQPGSPMRAEAVRVNPKTGAADLIDPEAVQMLDHRTGTRPTPVKPTDPDAKKPKKPKKPYNLPRNSVERKGFTGR